MICNKCFIEIEHKMIGRPINGGGVSTRINKTPPNILLLDVYKPYFILYVEGEKVQRNGKIKKIHFESRIIAEYCAKCGEKQNIKDDTDG